MNSAVGGKYTLLSRIARGGMGEVWAARNEMTGAEVALKLLRGDLPDIRSNQLQERFRNEARVGGLLSHRNIIRTYDLVEEPNGTLILVLELLRGETLRAYRERRGKIGAAEAVALILPILGALAHAHAEGIIHRDMNPLNVFLAVESDGHLTPKLLDFGIAKLPESTVATQMGHVLGTPQYMSPEQIRSETLTGASDLFSVGVVIYELLTGKNPFANDSPSASLAAVLEMEVDPEPEIDPSLWMVLRRALAKRPYERFASATEFAHALRLCVTETDAELGQYLRRDPIEIRPPPELDDLPETLAIGSLGIPRKPNAREKRIALSIAAALLLLGGIFWTFRARPNAQPGVTPTSATAATTAALTTVIPSTVVPAASGPTSEDTSIEWLPATNSAPTPRRPTTRPPPTVVQKKKVATNPGF